MGLRQIRAEQIAITEIAAGELAFLQIGTEQKAACQPRGAEIGANKTAIVGAHQSQTGTTAIGTAEVAVVQRGLIEVSRLQVDVAQVTFSQLGSTEMCLGQLTLRGEHALFQLFRGYNICS